MQSEPEEAIPRRVSRLSRRRYATTFHAEINQGNGYSRSLSRWSDGLWDLVSDEQILAALASDMAIDEKVHSLVNAANDAGGTDNITVAVLVWENSLD